jgi:ribonucleoside-diphosphate reductase alpha chain
LKINIINARDELLSEQGLQLVTKHYLKEGETSPQEAYARAAVAFCGGDLRLAKRIYDYVSKQWFMFSSPILSNAPAEGEKAKAMPISCFLSYVPDSVEGLINHQAETEWLSIKGGGVGGHWSSVRGVSKKAPGPIPFMHTVDAAMTAYKQGETRKGAYAAYLDVSHPDIFEFLNIRVPTGGDVNRKCFNIHNAVNLPDKFMEAVVRGDEWQLVDPHSKEVKRTTGARELWQRILEVRHRTGEPYLNFIDTVNHALNPFQQALGLKVHGSNLCNEIHLATDEQRTAVCCLSSVNIEKFDEWKDSRMIEDLTRYLDNVLEFFIQEAPDALSKAKYSALRERSIGIGAMGWHGYLQSKRIPFESAMAVAATHNIFSTIKGRAVEESKTLAKERGEPEDLQGSGLRNAHLLAIAPNANSSIICGCTPSIEPVKSNAYSHRTRIGTHLIKNKYLEKLLEEKGQNTEQVWSTILNHNGSVQHLEFLDEYEKDVFKTFEELDMHWVIEQAGARQEYLCQGQSINLSFSAQCQRSYLNSVHLLAWRKGLKGLYYVRSGAPQEIEKVSMTMERKALSSLLDGDEDVCISCQG